MLLLGGLATKRRWMARVALAILWLAGMPIVSTALMRAAEGGAEHRLAATEPLADAIVVLSGGRTLAPGKAAVSEWGDADRFFGGIDLYRAGRAPLLVFTGGRLPWEAAAATEGQVLAREALGMGVPAANILITADVATTQEEAHAVATLLASRRPAGATRPPAMILLVTSALHMPRARALFEQAGMTVRPFFVDFRQRKGVSVTVMDFLPSATALAETESVCRELFGRLFYAIAR